MKSKPHTFLIPLIVFILSSILLGLAILHSTLGESRSVIMLYCENMRDGWVKQPANSYSNLAFSILGLYIGWQHFRRRFSQQNIFAQHAGYPILMACAFIILGAGSFALHATNTDNGAFLDLLGMFLASSFFFSYAVKRSFNLSHLAFSMVFLLNMTGCIYVFWAPWNQLGEVVSLDELIILGHIILALVMEGVLIARKKIKVRFRWGILGIVCLIISFGIWTMSRTQESLWCNPDSLIQGHAVWHLLDAFSFYAFYRYYISENKVIG